MLLSKNRYLKLSGKDRNAKNNVMVLPEPRGPQRTEMKVLVKF